MSAGPTAFDCEDDYEPAWWLHCHDDEEDRRNPYAAIDWLFDQRLPRSGVALLVGPSEIGKTFVAIDLMRAVAAEKEFFGVKSTFRAGAVILAAEDIAGVRHRLLRLGDEALPVRAAHVENLRSGEAQRCVGGLLDEACKVFREKQLSGRGLGVVVVDTLSASGLLVDENNNAQCAEAMRALSSIATEHHCLVAVVHHPGKKGGGARGGSALFASADTVLEVRPTKRPGVATLECVKNRNGPKGTWGSFALEPCTIGRKADGGAITTMRVAPVRQVAAEAAGEVSPELAASIVAAVGERSLRKDPQSDGSVHEIIAECAGLDCSKAGVTSRTSAILKALLASGALQEKTAYIGGKHRPMVFARSNQPDL